MDRERLIEMLLSGLPEDQYRQTLSPEQQYQMGLEDLKRQLTWQSPIPSSTSYAQRQQNVQMDETRDIGRMFRRNMNP